MRTKTISLLTAVALSVTAFSATPVNAVYTTSDENSMVISYTYENGTVDAVLSANGSVCIGGLEASISYNKDKYTFKDKSTPNKDVKFLSNDIPSKGELVISVAANKNITDESELFKISFDSLDVPIKSDFSFDISDMYMFNENLDSDSVPYTINEKWIGFDEAISTTTSSVNTVSTTTTVVSTTEPISTTLNDNKMTNQFIVSILENKEQSSVEISLSVKGIVEFWTTDGSIKLNMSGLGTPTKVEEIPDALTYYKEDDNIIFFAVESLTGQNITEEQTIFTYSLPIESSDYSITCDPQIADICNAAYNDVKYEISVSGDKEPITTTSSTTTESTTTLTSTTTKSSSTTETTTSTTSTTSSEATATTTSENTKTITSETTTTTTSETTATTTETTTYETSVTTTDNNVNATPYELSNWAENDYYQKTGVAPYRSEYIENENGTVLINIFDDQGNVLETYTVHSKTGKGFNSNGDEVDLPQTGNNSLSPLAIAVISFIMVLFGIYAIKISGVKFKIKHK